MQFFGSRISICPLLPTVCLNSQSWLTLEIRVSIVLPRLHLLTAESPPLQVWLCLLFLAWVCPCLLPSVPGYFCCFSSVTQLCLTLCDPTDCSTPGLPVHHQPPELARSLYVTREVTAGRGWRPPPPVRLCFCPGRYPAASVPRPGTEMVWSRLGPARAGVFLSWSRVHLEASLEESQNVVSSGLFCCFRSSSCQKCCWASQTPPLELAGTWPQMSASWISAQ